MSAIKRKQKDIEEISETEHFPPEEHEDDVDSVQS